MSLDKHYSAFVNQHNDIAFGRTTPISISIYVVTWYCFLRKWLLSNTVFSKLNYSKKQWYGWEYRTS